jgi:hypothetical protein
MQVAAWRTNAEAQVNAAEAMARAVVESLTGAPLEDHPPELEDLQAALELVRKWWPLLLEQELHFLADELGLDVRQLS